MKQAFGTIKRRIQIFIAVLLICVACKSQKNNTRAVEGDTVAPNALTLLLQDSYSGTDTAELIVIKDQKTFGSFYSKINKTRKPGLVPPTIDFTKEMIVIFCNGETTGSMVPGLYPMEETDTIMILGVKQEDGHKKSGSTAVTTPFCIYKMPLTEKNITLGDSKN